MYDLPRTSIDCDFADIVESLLAAPTVCYRPRLQLNDPCRTSSAVIRNRITSGTDGKRRFTHTAPPQPSRGPDSLASLFSGNTTCIRRRRLLQVLRQIVTSIIPGEVLIDAGTGLCPLGRARVRTRAMPRNAFLLSDGSTPAASHCRAAWCRDLARAIGTSG
jgi:hypothetical protein